MTRDGMMIFAGSASPRLTRSICARRPVNCASAWQGPGYDYWRVVPDSVRIKGHGMLTSNQNRYDPGRYFPWASFYQLINNGAPPPADGAVYFAPDKPAPGMDAAGPSWERVTGRIDGSAQERRTPPRSQPPPGRYPGR